MAERRTVPVESGQRVVAVHHPAPSSAWLVFCHGFRSDKSGSYEERCERAVAEGYNAVRFDFRGCGEADGAFEEATLSARVADLRAVLEEYDPETFALFGSSFGFAVAAHAAAGEDSLGADDRLAALAGRAPVTDTGVFDPAREAVDERGEFRYDEDHAVDRRFFADLDRYALADVAGDVDAPVALFHGADDEVVPLADSLDATAALATDVLLCKYRGEGHRFSAEAEARMRDRLFDWLEET